MLRIVVDNFLGFRDALSSLEPFRIMAPDGANFMEVMNPFEDLV